jgi:hypothetical protein
MVLTRRVLRNHRVSTNPRRDADCRRGPWWVFARPLTPGLARPRPPRISAQPGPRWSDVGLLVTRLRRNRLESRRFGVLQRIPL